MAKIISLVILLLLLAWSGVAYWDYRVEARTYQICELAYSGMSSAEVQTWQQQNGLQQVQTGQPDTGEVFALMQHGLLVRSGCQVSVENQQVVSLQFVQW